MEAAASPCGHLRKRVMRVLLRPTHTHSLDPRHTPQTTSHFTLARDRVQCAAIDVGHDAAATHLLTPSTSHSCMCAHSLQLLPPTHNSWLPTLVYFSLAVALSRRMSLFLTTGFQARDSGHLPFDAWQRESTRSNTSVDMYGQRTSTTRVGPGGSMPRIFVTVIRFRTTIR